RSRAQNAGLREKSREWAEPFSRGAAELEDAGPDDGSFEVELDPSRPSPGCAPLLIGASAVAREISVRAGFDTFAGTPGGDEAAGLVVTCRPVSNKRKSAIEARHRLADPTSTSERWRRVARTLFALGTSGSVGSARLPARCIGLAPPARVGPPAAARESGVASLRCLPCSPS